MKILLVEDNEGHQIILKEAFEEAGVDWDLDIVEDGVQAIDFLKRQGEFKNASKPDMVILDLNLPRKNGREVLAEMRRIPQLQHTFVMILSNSGAPNDVCESYSLKANVYMQKPVGYHGFVKFAQMIRDWEGLVHYCTHG